MAIVTRGIEYKADVQGAEGVVSDVSKISNSLTAMGSSGDKTKSKLASLASQLGNMGQGLVGVHEAAERWLGSLKKLGAWVREGAALADAEANFNRIGLDLREIQKQSSFTQTTEEIQKAATATAALVSSLQLTREQTQQLYNASAGLADAYNKDLDPTIRAVAAAAYGNTRALRQQFGIYVDTKTALKEYAKELGVSVSALTAQQKAAALTNETVTTLKRSISNWPTKEMVTPFDQISTAWSDFWALVKKTAGSLVVSFDEVTGAWTRFHSAVTGDWKEDIGTRAEQELAAIDRQIAWTKEGLGEYVEQLEAVERETFGIFKQAQIRFEASFEWESMAKFAEQTRQLIDLEIRRNTAAVSAAAERVGAQLAALAEGARQARLKVEAEVAEEEEQRREARKSAVAAARAQLQRDQDALAKIREEGVEAEWAAVEHTEIEQIQHDAERRRKAAEATIKNAKVLASALEAIAEQEAAAVSRATEQEAQARAQAVQDAADMAQRAIAGAASYRWDSGATEAGQEQAALERTLDEIQKQTDALEEARAALLAAPAEAADETLAQLQAITEQELALDEQLRQAQLAGQAKIAAARERDAWARKKADEDAIRRQYDLTDAQKAALAEQIKGVQMFAEAGQQLFGNAGVFQAAEMLASGIQSGADAAQYAAKSIAAYASGNIAAGTGYAAAAVASTAAAAKYAAGLAELGARGFQVESAPAETSGASSAGAAAASSRSLTGEAETPQAQELTVNLTFQGEAANVGRYLIDKINGEAYTKGGAKIDTAVMRRR